MVRKTREDGLSRKLAGKVDATIGVSKRINVIRLIKYIIYINNSNCNYYMWLPFCTALAAVVLALVLSANVSTARAQHESLTSDQRQVVDTVATVFTAARTDDVAKFDSVIASDFYIFDGGTRFKGEAIMALIKAQHVAGKRYEWNVTEPDVHISGNTAWIAYVNKGSITDAFGTTNQRWLESAFLQKQAGLWKIVFMHSTRIPLLPPENHGEIKRNKDSRIENSATQ
jgi:ketosteroid isomerase-like protein